MRNKKIFLPYKAVTTSQKEVNFKFSLDENTTSPLVINEIINLADRHVLYKKEVIGEITANTWSPKYSVYLAYARCDFKRIEALKELNVKSATGLVKAKITDLPFNFEALGLGSQS